MGRSLNMDKGKSEHKTGIEAVLDTGIQSLVMLARRNFMVPIPRFATYDALNTYLEQCCLKRLNDTPQRLKQTIGEKLLRDLDALMTLPRVAF